MLAIQTAHAATMTSREIADLVEKRHDNVKRTIETMANQQVISYPQIEDGQKSSNGIVERQYLVGKRDSYVIVAQLSPEFTARLVDRWQELERKIAKPAELSRMDILKLAIESEEGRLKAEAQLALAAPAVAFVDRYVHAEGLKGFREVCKLLAANESKFKAFLLEAKIMYRLGGTLTAHQNHIDAGRFEVRTGEANEHAYTATKFTPKGVTWIAGEWAKHSIKGVL